MKPEKLYVTNNDNSLKIPYNPTIVFGVKDKNGEFVIKIDKDGNFYSHGKLVINDKKIYKAFVRFLKDGGYYKKRIRRE